MHGFLSESAKEEYDELYEYITKSYDANTDIIMNDTTLSQIEDCVSKIPIVFSKGSRKEYQRVYNTKRTLTKTNRTVNLICAMQPMNVLLK